MPNNISVDQKFKFLISCIRWSDKGVIDFNGVAAECGIVNRAAASKRYSRLMKEHGVNPNGSLNGNGGQAASPKTTQATEKNTLPELMKKRKLSELTETLNEIDDGSDADQVKNQSSKRSRKNSTLASFKDEEGLGMIAAGLEETWDGFIKTEGHDDEA